MQQEPLDMAPACLARCNPGLLSPEYIYEIIAHLDGRAWLKPPVCTWSLYRYRDLQLPPLTSSELFQSGLACILEK